MTPERRTRIEAAAAVLVRSSRGRTERPRAELDEQLTSAFRVIVTAAGLGLFHVTGGGIGSRQGLVYAALGAYVTYSVVHQVLVLRRAPRPSAALSPWLDVAWTTLVVAVSDGTSSVFFTLYLFAILCAAFHGGFRRGMAIVLASIVSFSTVAAIPWSTLQTQLELDRVLIQPLHLLVLGYLISYWGEHELRLRARVDLLRDVTTLSNPRFGIDSTVGRFLSKLRTFYGAESCRLVVEDAASGECWTRAASRAAPESSPAMPLPDPVARLLLSDNLTSTLVFGFPSALARLRRRCELQVLGCDPDALRSSKERASADQPTPVPTIILLDQDVDRGAGDAIATALGAASFVSVPFRYQSSAVARLFVAWSRPRVISRAEVDFLLQVVQQVVPLLENVRLVDRMASHAAEEERRRIARDIHDSVIQPYIGLHLGLVAVRSALSEGRSGEAEQQLERLSALAQAEVASLRSYVHAIVDRADRPRDGALAGAVRRFCGRFADATGIRVEVKTEAAPVNDRLAAEVFQMVAEGLSNVRRHTDASRAEVRIAVEDGRMRVTIENDGAPASCCAGFSPRSLRERTAALGGDLEVAYRAPDTTAVQIEIPL